VAHTKDIGIERSQVLPVIRALLVLYTVALLALPSNVGVDTGLFVLSPARFFLTLALTAALVEGLRSGVWGPPPPRAVSLSWLCFIGAATVSSLLNPSSDGILRVGSMVVEGPLLFWLVWRLAQQPGRGGLLLETAVIVATVSVAVITTLLPLTGYRYDAIVHGLQGIVQPAEPPIRFGIQRQQGPFTASLFYAVWLLSTSALILPRIEMAHGLPKTIWVLTWVAAATATVTTLSRLAIVGIPATLALYSAFRRMRGRASVMVAATIVTSLIVFGGLRDERPVVLNSGGSSGETAESAPSQSVAPSTVLSPAPSSAPASPERQIVTIEALASSNQARVDALVAAVSAISERPLFGWGPTTAQEVAFRILGSRNPIDSSYLVVSIEFGLVGLLAFLALIGAVLIPARKVRDPLGIGLLMACMALAAAASVVAVFATTQLYAAFWLLAGALAARTACGGEPVGLAGRLGVQPESPRL
jgi:hypothetical protein